MGLKTLESKLDKIIYLLEQIKENTDKININTFSYERSK